MFQRVGYSILVHTGSDVVGNGFHVIVGITHGYADTGMAQHADVVSSVAEGHGFFQLDAEVADNLVDTVLFGVSFGCHVCEGGMPAAHLAVGDGGQDDCFFFSIDKGSQLEEGFVRMAVGIGFCLDGVYFQLAVEDFLHCFVGLVHADVVLSHQNAGDAAFVAESCQGIHFRCRYGAFVDNGIFYKAIGAVHRNVAVYQIPFLQGGQVVDDDARTSGRNEDMYAFGLGGSQRFNGGNGNFVGLEADQGSVDVKKQSFYHKSFFYLVSCARNYLKKRRYFVLLRANK